MKFEELTPELKTKALACKTPEDVLTLAKEEGYELSDKELESLSGGEALYECGNYDSGQC